MVHQTPLRTRSRLGKYRIEKRLAQGGFADVYQAYDTVEGIRVALKVPRHNLVSTSLLDDFRREVRLTAELDHPGILAIKNADTIEGRFVIVSKLGLETLQDRLRRRLSLEKAFGYAEQVLEALAYAHSCGVLHCDVKPDNVILFHDGRVRLTDFGIAKVSVRTLLASGSGTLGYMAPEQAMGRPSMRSDVFSAGLMLYRMFAGALPEWPFHWPPANFGRARKKLHPDLVAVLRKSLEVDAKKRYPDAGVMLAALRAVKQRSLRYSRGARATPPRTEPRRDWRSVRVRQFLRKYRGALGIDGRCRRCDGPVSEAMRTCPWCGRERKQVRAAARGFPRSCPRCRRGVKSDWRYCPWCYGASIGPASTRSYDDRRYTLRCPNKKCEHGRLMPFMRYCPWCRTKVKRAWPIADGGKRCRGCGWGVLTDYWGTCPWCARALDRGRRAHGGAAR